MRPILLAVGVLALLPWLMGATITLEVAWSKPMVPNDLEESGKFTYEFNEIVANVVGKAQLVNTEQVTSVGANYEDPPAPGGVPNNWIANMTLAPGTYDCWGTLYYYVPPNPMPQQKDSNHKNAVVN